MKSVSKEKLLEHYEVIDGAPIAGLRAVICAVFRPALNEGAFVSQVFWYEPSGWLIGPMIGFEAVSLVWDHTTSTALVLGREGNLARIAADRVLEQSVIGDENSVGPFRHLRILGKDILAVGETRSIYQWHRGTSRRLTGRPSAPEAVANSEEDLVASIIADSELLFDIDGPNARDLVGVGSDGAIWRLGRDELLRLDSPTNLPLYCISNCAPNLYCVGGRAGLVLKGNDSQWDEFAIIEAAGDLCSTVTYQGCIYVCDGQGIYTSPTGDPDFSPVPILAHTVPSHALRSDGEFLLSIAGKEVFMTSDGRQWLELL